MTNPLRLATRSDHAPDPSLSKLDTESATPSMIPRSKRLPPSTVMRNCGSRGKIISLATSFRQLAQPSSLTFRGRVGRDDSITLAPQVSKFHELVVIVASDAYIQNDYWACSHRPCGKGRHLSDSDSPRSLYRS